MFRKIAFLTFVLFLITWAAALAGDPAAQPPTAKVPAVSEVVSG